MINQTRQEGQFNYSTVRQVQKSRFDLSHEKRMTFNMGWLTPLTAIPTLAGDEFEVSAHIMTRMHPLYWPIMSRLNMEVHWFYVPNRLLWDGWKDFISDFASTSQTHVPPFVRVDYSDLVVSGSGVYTSFWEYIGVPTPIPDESPISSDVLTLNALPYLAYLKIYNDFYINPIIQDYTWDAIYEDVVDGSNDARPWWTTDNPTDNTNNGGIKFRNWNKDFYTAATPTPQSGTGVRIPVFDQNYTTSAGNLAYGAFKVKDKDGLDPGLGANTSVQLGSTTQASGQNNLRSSAATDVLYLDVQETAGTIAQFRYANALQQLLERMNRSGSRYRDTMRVVFGTDPLAGVIDFSILFGYSQSTIQISDVMITASTDFNAGADTEVAGDYSGKAVGFHKGEIHRIQTAEHGWIFGIVNIQPRSSYMQGLPKHLKGNQTWFDYPIVDFAHIGDEEITNSEFMHDFQFSETATENADTWAYIPKYSHYRYINDITCAKFRIAEYQDWHITRHADPNVRPALVDSFLQTQDLADLTNQVFQKATTEHDVFMYAWITILAWRPLPKYAIPMLT